MTICLNCGADTDAPRSNLDHNRLMRIIRAASHHWPERCRFKPIGMNQTLKFEHLRAWLFCQVGYCWIEELDAVGTDGVSKDSAVATTRSYFETVEARQGYKFWWPTTDGITRCRTPRSASFENLNQRDFGDLRDAVSALIERELGISIPQLLKEHEAAA